MQQRLPRIGLARSRNLDYAPLNQRLANAGEYRIAADLGCGPLSHPNGSHNSAVVAEAKAWAAMRERWRGSI